MNLLGALFAAWPRRAVIKKGATKAFNDPDIRAAAAACVAIIKAADIDLSEFGKEVDEQHAALIDEVNNIGPSPEGPGNPQV